MVVAYDSEQLVLRKGLFVVMDLVAIVAESLDRVLADVLENQKLELLVVERMENTGLTKVRD